MDIDSFYIHLSSSNMTIIVWVLLHLVHDCMMWTYVAHILSLFEWLNCYQCQTHIRGHWYLVLLWQNCNLIYRNAWKMYFCMLDVLVLLVSKCKFALNGLLHWFLFAQMAIYSDVFFLSARQESKADALELNLSCPHGMGERGMGLACGQVRL